MQAQAKVRQTLREYDEQEDLDRAVRESDEENEAKKARRGRGRGRGRGRARQGRGSGRKGPKEDPPQGDESPPVRKRPATSASVKRTLEPAFKGVSKEVEKKQKKTKEDSASTDKKSQSMES